MRNHRLVAVVLLATATAGCAEPYHGPTTVSGVNPPASNCGALTTVAPPHVGGTLQSGETTTIVQGGTYVLPSGSLRLISTGAGQIVLTAPSGIVQGTVPMTQDFTGPGTLLVGPTPTLTITISVCAP